MRHKSLLRVCAVAVAWIVTASCSLEPTANDLDEFFERTLESVHGPWSGTIGNNQATLNFSLSQTGTAVTGSGTMREPRAELGVPITITGSFQRPNLSLTINGMVFEGTNVQGTAQGNYTSVGGISTQIRLVGSGYDKTLPLHIAEIVVTLP